MTRRNPEIETLTRENDALRRQLAELRRDPGDMPVNGCGDNSCVVAQPMGMSTNAGCRCDLRTVRAAMLYWGRLARFRQETIREMRSQSNAVVEALERLKVGTFVLEVRCTFAGRVVSVATSQCETQLQYRVTDQAAEEYRSVVVPTAHEAADYFSTWLREATEREKAP